VDCAACPRGDDDGLGQRDGQVSDKRVSLPRFAPIEWTRVIWRRIAAWPKRGRDSIKDTSISFVVGQRRNRGVSFFVMLARARSSDAGFGLGH